MPPVFVIPLVLAAVTAALGLRGAIDGAAAAQYPLVTLFGAVAVSGWAGGWRAGVAAAVLGYAGADWFFIEPRGALSVPRGADLAAVVLYALTCALIVGIGESLRRARNAEAAGRAWLQAAFSSIGDAVITTDSLGRIERMNGVAERLCGWTAAAALGRASDEVFRLIDGLTRAPVASPVTTALASGAAVGLAEHTTLIARDGSERLVDDSAAPICNASGEVLGCVLVFRDMTERRLSERSLRDSTRLLSGLSNSTRDLFVVRDLDATPIFANPAARAVLGAALVTSDLLDIGHRCIVAGEAAWSGEEQCTLEDGRVIDLSWTLSPQRDEAGMLNGVIAVGHDVTAARRDTRLLEGQRRALECVATGAEMDEVLRALSACVEDVAPGTRCSLLLVQGHALRVVPDASLAAAYLQALDGSSREPPYVGPCAMAAHLGVEVEAADTANDERWSPEWRELAATHDLRSCRTVPVRGRDGRVLATFALYRSRPLQPTDGQDLPLLRLVADIAGIAIDKYEAERQRDLDLAVMSRIQASATRLLGPGEPDVLLNELLAAAADVLDTDKGNIQFVDPATGALHIAVHQGHGEAFLEHFGRRGWSCGAAAESHNRVVIEDVTKLPIDPGSEWADSLPFLLADGIRAIQSTPLVSRDGRLIGILSNHFDRPRSLDAREQRCLDVVARMAADLYERTRVEAALREADRRKDEFLATLAHELRNPLAPIRHGVELLRLRATLELQPTVEMLERQVGQLVRLVEDLLDMSRISQGRIELRRQRVDMGTVMQQALEAVQPALRQARHRLEVHAGPPVQVDADPARLAQAIGNVLSNASKFTPPGGRIEVGTALERSGVVVRVRDSGAGIAPDQLEAVFDMFSRVRPAAMAEAGGLGLGLTLARRIFELHGGTISAHSEGPGRGSEFVIRLPSAVPEPNRAPDTRGKPGGADAANTTAPRRVLVVDDNRDAATTLAALLGSAGHSVQVAFDAEQALERAEAFRPQVVLLDIGMPVVDGHEVCRRLRGLPWAATTTIVALTGWGQPEDRIRSDDAGFDAHLVKPADAVAILDLIEGATA